MLDKMGNRRALRKKTKKEREQGTICRRARLRLNESAFDQEEEGKRPEKQQQRSLRCPHTPQGPPPPVGSLSSRALIAFNAPYLTWSPGVPLKTKGAGGQGDPPLPEEDNR